MKDFTPLNNVCSQIKEEKEEKEKEGEKEEIFNRIYILIEWRCVKLECANYQFPFQFYLFFCLLFHYKLVNL